MLFGRLEPNNLGGMDVLAALLAKDKKSNKELEALASKAMSVSEEAPESWVALGYYCHSNRKMSKALYFAHKGCMAQKTFRFYKYSYLILLINFACGFAIRF